MKALVNLSGGAIKFIALISAFNQLLKTGVKVKAISGVSSGAIISFLYACGRMEEGIDLARKSHDINLIFSRKNRPVGKLAGLSLSAWLKIIRGKTYICEMDNLEKNIRGICSVKDFWKYKSDPNAPDCYVLALDKKQGRHVVANLKTLSYNEAIDLVIGSSSICPTAKPREFYGMAIVDGGHRGHSAGAYLLKNNIEDIQTKVDTVFTVYSRPEPEDYEKEEFVEASNFFQELLGFTIPVAVKETSLNDEYVERTECENLEIPYVPIYIPKFTSDTYKATKEEIQEGENLGIWAVSNYYLEEV